MRIVIVGGGIGGFALATFLNQRGIDHVVIERAPSFKALGHFIALKGDGVEVLDRLGVRAACDARALPASLSMTYRTAAGHPLHRQPASDMDEALGGFLMLRRADLSDVLYRNVAGETDVRFGTEVTAIQQKDGGAVVTLSDGSTEHADVVVGADGVHSSIRRMVFGDGGERDLDGSYVAVEVKLAHDLEPGEVVSFLGRGRVVNVLALGEREIAAVVYHGGEDLRPKLRGPRETRAFFAREYAAFHPLVRTLFSAIDADSFVFVDAIRMVTLPSIVSNNVALLGDAAACPTFLSGMGSAYAMLSAERLADAISGDDLTRGLAHYAREAEAHAATLQSNALRMRELILGQSRVMTAIRNSVLAVAPMSWLLLRARRFYDVKDGGRRASA